MYYFIESISFEEIVILYIVVCFIIVDFIWKLLTKLNFAGLCAITQQYNQNKKNMRTQSTKLRATCVVSFLMMGFLPEISSRSITPKEKTSDLSVSCPVEAYSGERYLYH